MEQSPSRTLTKYAAAFSSFRDSIMNEIEVIRDEIAQLKDFLQRKVEKHQEKASAASTKKSTSILDVSQHQKKMLISTLEPMKVNAIPSSFEIPDDFLENKKNDCGICHRDCTNHFGMSVTDPCGHYPYCDGCIQKLKAQKSNKIFSLQDYLDMVEDVDESDDYIFNCPQCKEKVKLTHRVNLVKHDDVLPL